MKAERIEVVEEFIFEPPAVPQPLEIITQEFKAGMLTDIVFTLRLPEGLMVDIIPGVPWFDTKTVIKAYKQSYNL
jgi:hypothetical protein